MIKRTPAFLLFGMILGVASACFAEVPLMHSPQLLYNPSRLVLTVPIYVLHIVFLATLLVRFRMVTFPMLYFCGILFGLYEAFLTKVVWSPAGHPIPIRFLSIHWIETIFLIFFWHPVFSLIIPLAFVEDTCTRTSTVRSLSELQYITRWNHALLIPVILFLGSLQGAVSSGPFASISANLLSFGFLLIAVLVWRRCGLHDRTLRHFLPRKTSIKWLLGLLLLLYGILGFILRPGKLPTDVLPYLPVLLLYLFTVFVLLSARPQTDTVQQERELPDSIRPYVGYFLVYLLTSFTATHLPAAMKNMIFLVFYGSSFLFGLLLFSYSIYVLFKPYPPGDPDEEKGEF